MKINRYGSKKCSNSPLFLFYQEKRAWIDLIISKTALIFATVVIMAALYHLAADIEQLDQKRELELIAQDLKCAIDSAGGSQQVGTPAKSDYTFNSDIMDNGLFGSVNVSVSGEYVTVSSRQGGREIFHAEPLTYRTLAISREELSNEMLNKFSASGNESDPVLHPFTYGNVSDFLSVLGTKEADLNTSTEVHIVKTLIYCVNGTEQNELEYILVYQ